MVHSSSTLVGAKLWTSSRWRKNNLGWVPGILFCSHFPLGGCVLSFSVEQRFLSGLVLVLLGPRVCLFSSAQVKRILRQHYSALRAIFRYYSALSTGDPFLMSQNGFTELMNQCAVPNTAGCSLAVRTYLRSSAVPTDLPRCDVSFSPALFLFRACFLVRLWCVSSRARTLRCIAVGTRVPILWQELDNIFIVSNIQKDGNPAAGGRSTRTRALKRHEVCDLQPSIGATTGRLFSFRAVPFVSGVGHWRLKLLALRSNLTWPVIHCPCL